MANSNHLRDLLGVYSVDSVVEFIESLSADEDIRWRLVGDRENNLATINLGSDPAAGVVERITNAIDAVTDRKWESEGKPDDIHSPRMAAQEWFGIENGTLTSYTDKLPSDLVEISRLVSVVLNESGDPKSPTVDIRDRGIGLTRQDFPDTILSLNASMKLKKRFLAGAFGQGGSTALAYSAYTLIATRYYRDADPTVSFTIVRFNPGNYSSDKHGTYEYLVSSDNLPFSCVVGQGEEFEPGTLVRHVKMDVGKFSSVMTAPRNSLWYLAHHYLFDPIIPIDLQDQRKGRNDRRYAAGNARRLVSSDRNEYSRSARLTFRLGKVSIAWYVLSAEGEKSNEYITNFCLPSRPIVITFNGQKQGDLPNTIIRNDLKLPYLDRYLVVHINCDELDSETRRQLFPTTRESVRDSSLLTELRDLVVGTLGEDDDLDRLNRERRKRFISDSSDQATEKLRRRLSDRVAATIKVGQKGGQPGQPGSDHKPSLKEPIPVSEPPTFIEITTPSPRDVYSGRPFSVKFRTDADPSYFGSVDSYIATADNSAVIYSGTTNIYHGYGNAYFHVQEGAGVGEDGTITLEVRPKGAKSVAASVGIKIVEEKKPAGGQGKDSTGPNINPRWVTEDDEFFKQNGWDRTSVADVEDSEEGIDVFVSNENSQLLGLLNRAKRRGEESVASIKSFYLEHIAFHAVLCHLTSSAESVDNEEEGSPSGFSKEIARASETILGISASLIDLIESESL